MHILRMHLIKSALLTYIQVSGVCTTNQAGAHLISEPVLCLQLGDVIQEIRVDATKSRINAVAGMHILQDPTCRIVDRRV